MLRPGWRACTLRLQVEHGHAVGVILGADQGVGSRLGRGIRAIGRVRSRFRERRILERQRSVDLIGRDMQEAIFSLSFLIQFRPISSGFLEQVKGAIHVGANEIVGVVDGAVHMTLGGQVHNGAGG
jgi:hypothetical protein